MLLGVLALINEGFIMLMVLLVGVVDNQPSCVVVVISLYFHVGRHYLGSGGWGHNLVF